MASEPPEVVRVDAPQIAVTYVTMFEPVIAITVPDFDDDGDGVNDFSGANIVVIFSLSAGSETECSGNLVVNWQVDDSGAVTRQVSEGETATALRLVGYVPGATSLCEYDVQSAASGVAARGLALISSDASVTATSTLVTVSYGIVATVFEPDITIAVPAADADEDEINDFAGTVFTVGFAPVTNSNAGCSAAASGVWEIGADGDVALQGGALAAASLVDRPRGAVERCEYDVEFPETAAPGGLVLRPEVSATVSAVAESAAAAYVTVFEPAITLDVPSDETFGGISITVSFTPVLDSHADCTASASEVWDVAAVMSGGEFTGIETTLSDEAASLVDRPAGDRPLRI